MCNFPLTIWVLTIVVCCSGFLNAGTVHSSNLTKIALSQSISTSAVQSKVSNVTDLLKNKNDQLTGQNKTPLMTDASEPRAIGLTLILIFTVGFILLLPILLILAVLFLVPLPSIYYPPGILATNGVLVTGRRDKNQFMDRMGQESMQTLRGILDSDDCMERVSCEIMRASKGLRVDKWLSRVINELPMGNELKWKIARAANASKNCKRYVCDPMSSIWNMFSF